PAIALAALTAQKMHGDALLVVLPADHLIQDSKAFHAALKHAVVAAQENQLVTFGIVPTHPETGYGYIKARSKKGASSYPVEKFVEKPDLATAKRYLKGGQYYWNSGMFVFRASAYLEELGKYQPKILAACREAVASAQQDLDFLRVDKTAFAKSP